MTHFITREVAKILQLSEDRVRSCVRAGFVSPDRGPRRRYEFTFQHLLLLKTTKGLLQSGIPAGKIRRVWSSLKQQLSDDLPLTRLTLHAEGNQVVVWDGTARWQPDSGQFLIDFEAERAEADSPPPCPFPTPALGRPAPSTSGGAPEDADAVEASLRDSVACTPRRIRRDPPPPWADDPASPSSADHWFEIACELETHDPLEARRAYHKALELDPELAVAHVNLGRHYHEAGELEDAERHYRAAIDHGPEDAVSHFNLGVLLEDRKRPAEAVYAYLRAVSQEPEFADAHYNLGLVLERLGRRSEAITHMMTARLLYGQSSPAPGE